MHQSDSLVRSLYMSENLYMKEVVPEIIGKEEFGYYIKL